MLRTALSPLADRIDGAVLFGSVAKGAATVESDIDVLVVGSTEFAEVHFVESVLCAPLIAKPSPSARSRQARGRRTATAAATAC